MIAATTELRRMPTPPTPEPLAGSTRDRFRAIVERALLAPSSHNMQPWLFRISGDALELCADDSRALPTIDPDRRELLMSCGAALFHARLAIRHHGYHPEVELIPDPRDPILMARIRVGAPLAPTEREEELYSAIPRRRTIRHQFEDRAVPWPLLVELGRAAALEHAWLRVVDDEQEKLAVADLIAAGDRWQARDPGLRRELAACMHSNNDPAPDGIPGHAFGFGDFTSRIAPYIIRSFDWGNERAGDDRDLALRSPALVVLGTNLEGPATWLRAGQALARVLLTACVDGVSASFLNQPIEVPDLRHELAWRLGVRGYPQLLLRIGYAPAVDARRTPRRTVDEVLIPY
jgi:hypothetical protein